MNFRIFSDLHNDQRRSRGADNFIIPPRDNDKEDVLVLAGDIDANISMLAAYINTCLVQFAAVIFVPGNHEYYGGVPISTYESHLMTMIDDPKRFIFLNNKTVYIGGYKIIGSTLWSQIEPQHYKLMYEYMNDYRVILSEPDVPFTVQKNNEMNDEAVKFLEQELNAPQIEDWVTIVITHHSPSYSLANPKYKGDPRNCGYHNNLDKLTQKVDYWVYGHTHDAKLVSFEHWDCVVRTNSVGYTYEKTNYCESSYLL